jgi:hypothetical protein
MNFDTVARIIGELPGTAEGSSATGRRWWTVRNKTIAFEGRLRRSELEALGDRARVDAKSAILGVWLPDLMTKATLLSSAPDVFFTTPHFDGHPSVLVRLARIRVKPLRELLVEAWRGRAPKRLVAEFSGGPRPRRLG